MVTPPDFIHRLENLNHLVQHDKRCNWKALHSSLHLNGITFRFLAK